MSYFSALSMAVRTVTPAFTAAARARLAAAGDRDRHADQLLLPIRKMGRIPRGIEGGEGSEFGSFHF